MSEFQVELKILYLDSGPRVHLGEIGPLPATMNTGRPPLKNNGCHRRPFPESGLRALGAVRARSLCHKSLVELLELVGDGIS